VIVSLRTYNGKIILRGEKDQSMDLWTLPLGSHDMTSQHATSTLPLAAPDFANANAQPVVQIAFFAHTVQTKANSICFAHQSLCSPRISMLLKAIKHGYLKGCPNLTAHSVNKYLNPSPAMAKGHMKCPRQRIRITSRVPHVPSPSVVQSRIVPDEIHLIAHTHMHVMDNNDKDSEDRIPIHVPHANVIESDDDSNGNVFVFAAFADKQNGTLYSDLTGTFPFMSLEGNVCFLVVYYYETNAIMAVPIANFTDNAILKAFHQQFELLESKGHKIQLNVMNNQACMVVKEYLTAKECKNMLVKPNNHRVNSAERAIQTFKVHFISALATTDSNFPLQLWDQLTPQVETTLNMLRPSQIDPNMSAYEAVHGPYNWNRFPLAPPGCKAVIYEAPELRGSWASHGTDAWYVGPSLDHYQCNHYFLPDTRAYCVSGSAELFPQHCQVLFLLWNENFQEVIDELTMTLNELPPKQRAKFLTMAFKRLQSG
jgi:hypothetical protein